MGLIENNPFFILGVSINDKRQTVLQLAEEQGLLGDADVCEAAATQLTNVKKRLAAEMRWFPGTPDDKIKELIKSLTSNASLVSLSSSLNNLSKYTYILAVTEKQRPTTPDQLVTLQKLIVELDQTYQVLHAEDIIIDINNARESAGIPPIDSITAITEEIIALRIDTKNILSNTLSSLTVHDLVSLTTAIATSEVNKPRSSFGVILEDVMSLYEVKAERILSQSAEDVYEDIDNLKEYLEEIDKTHHYFSPTFTEVVKNAKKFDEMFESVPNVISAKVDKILKNVEEFEKYAQPLQLLSHAKGTSHELSEEVAFQVRELAITLCNDYVDYDFTKETLKITTALQHICTELPVMAELLSTDTAILNKEITGIRVILIILLLLIVIGLIVGLKAVLQI